MHPLRGSAMALLQSAIQNVTSAPNFWPITATATLLGVILTAWTLLGRISARFNQALDSKLAPLTKELKEQGDRFQREASRLEGHFDDAIRSHEATWRKEITSIANSLRSEIKALNDQLSDMRGAQRENRTMIDGHGRDLQESRMDRQQIRRDLDNVSRSLEAFERSAEGGREKILHAIGDSREVIAKSQSEFSTRLTRVEEALKFYAKVRTDQS